MSEQDVYNTAGQVLMRYNGSGGWLEGEVWAEGNHLAIYANGQTYFPLTDQVGTERARFSYAGAVVETCMSQPFGDNLQCTGTDSSPYKFGKLERDGESGDDHAQHRDYNSNPYRWLTPDPMGKKVAKLDDPQTWNMYAYVRNNPTTLSDPTGATPVACYLNGSQISCQDLYHQLSVGTAVQCPNNECGGLRAVMGGGGSTEWQQWVPGTQETTTLKDPDTGAVIGTYPGTSRQGYWATVAAVAEEGAELGPWDLALVTGASAAILLYKNRDTVKQMVSLMNNVASHINLLNTDPGWQPRNHWRKQIRGWLKELRGKANRLPPALQEFWTGMIDAAERAVPED